VTANYGEDTSSDKRVQMNIADHNCDGIEVGWYNDHHMKTMLNDAFRNENDSPVTVQAEAFYNMLESHNNAYMKGALPKAFYNMLVSPTWVLRKLVSGLTLGIWF